MAPTLSIVIPVYNEPHWIGSVVDDLVTAVSRAEFQDLELIIVDDGSDQPTQQVLASLRTPFPMRVLRQANSGRFAARRAGIEAATRELVLLLDARVSLDPDALAFVATKLNGNERLPIWNAHVHADLRGNPFGRFWSVIEFLAFRDYLSDPRPTSYGPDEFDRYPKGTTCFLAPRELLHDAMSGFHSYYKDTRDANDDTPVIRSLAARQRINIAPGFSCVYRPRTSWRQFVRHAYHRGGVFVDGYGRPGTRFFATIVAFYPLSAISLALAIRHPRRALPAIVAAPLAGAAAVLALKRAWADAIAVATVGPLWRGAFSAGMWRGLWLALRPRLRHAR